MDAQQLKVFRLVFPDAVLIGDIIRTTTDGPAIAAKVGDAWYAGAHKNVLTASTLHSWYEKSPVKNPNILMISGSMYAAINIRIGSEKEYLERSFDDNLNMVKFYHWKNKCIDLEKNIAFWCNVPKCSGGASHPEHNGELTISGEGKFGIVRVTGDDGVLRIVEIIAGNGHFIPIELFETIRNTLPPQTAMVEIPIDTQKESAGIVLDHRVESIIKKANDYKAELTKWTKDLAAAPDAFALAEILQRRPAPAF